MKLCYRFLLPVRFTSLLITFYWFMLPQLLKAQNNYKSDIVISADSLYLVERYNAAARLYFKAFDQQRAVKTTTNLFNAAKACSKARYADSAFRFLLIIADNKAIDSSDEIIYEPAFAKLHKDKRWKLLLSHLVRQQSFYKAPVAAELIAMYGNRFAMAQRDSAIAKHYGANSLKRSIFLDTIKRADSVNSLKLRSILNTYGLPGPEAIGGNGVKALIFIYQKADLSFQKHYFSFIAEAFKKGIVNANSYATIADRISLFDTGRQIYGTQFKQSSNILYPVENKDSVNIRRQTIGLEPIVVN